MSPFVRFYFKTLDLPSGGFGELILPNAELFDPLVDRQLFAGSRHLRSKQKFHIRNCQRVPTLLPAVVIERFEVWEYGRVDFLGCRIHLMPINNDLCYVRTLEQFVFHLFGVNIPAVGSAP